MLTRQSLRPWGRLPARSRRWRPAGANCKPLAGLACCSAYVDHLRCSRGAAGCADTGQNSRGWSRCCSCYFIKLCSLHHPACHQGPAATVTVQCAPIRQHNRSCRLTTRRPSPQAQQWMACSTQLCNLEPTATMKHMLKNTQRMQATSLEQWQRADCNLVAEPGPEYTTNFEQL